MELEININRYINGELSGEDLSQFEALLKKDETLKEQVQFHMEVDEALGINEEVEENQNLKSILSELGKTHIRETEENIAKGIEKKERKEIIANPEIFPKNKSRLKKLYPFAVLAAAAAFLLFMFLPSLQNKSYSEIADSNFRVYQFNDTYLGKESDEDLLKKANENYTKGNWNEAINKFNQYLQAKPNVPKVLLAKGCALFKLAEFDNAIESLNKVIMSEDSDIYQPTANWYMALCYLKKNNSTKAIKYLEAIQKGQDNFAESNKILRQLK